MNNRNGSLSNHSVNLNIRGLGLSPTLAINQLAKKLERKGVKVYKMGLGQSPFPVPAPVVEALRAHADEKDYLNVYGLEALRKAVAHYHREKDLVNVRANQILIGPGSKELMFILQLAYYGEILLPTPCWVSYAPQAKIIGRNVKLLHTTRENNWRISANQLQEHIESEKDRDRPRLMVINYPSNPDGGTYDADSLKNLAKVARKYRIIILSDEIYGQLHYKGEHVSIARFYPEGTIISSGLSKWCGAGGWRLGSFAFPRDFEWLMDPMAAVASETYTSVSAPIQYAAIRAFRGGDAIERYLCHTRRILAFIAKRIVKKLNDADITTLKPDGAFYLFLDFSNHSDNLARRGIKTAARLCEKLLDETGVALLPGESFQREPSELLARLSFVNFDGARALAFSETISPEFDLPDSFADTHCANLFEGIRAIADWIKSV